MKKQTYIFPVIALLAVFVFVGQGCPGQEAAAPSNGQPDAVTDDRSPNPYLEEEAPGEVYDIAIPEDATDYSGPTHPDATEQAAGFRVPDMTVAEVKSHFMDAIPAAGWENMEEEVNPIGTFIYATKDNQEVSVVLKENDDLGGIDVDMLLGPANPGPLGM